MSGITAEQVKQLAATCGFELAGITAALPHEDYGRFEDWRTTGFAGEMRYMTDHRGDLRSDPRSLLANAQSVVCVGMLYNSEGPHTDDVGTAKDTGWISRYAWGGDSDYHDILRHRLTELVKRIAELHTGPFSWRICVDTAPLLERSYARAAGLGWIGKNTCLINQGQGSWFFLGELLLSIPLDTDVPPPERCGSCRRCIDACPTAAIVPALAGGWTLDATLCISYLTIEKLGDIPAPLAEQMTNHLFGCDICQDVCPWNRKAPVSQDARFAPKQVSPSLADLAELDESAFRDLFRRSPVWRTKYEGFLRNVAIAMGNSRNRALLAPLERLAQHPNTVIAAAARQAIKALAQTKNSHFSEMI